VSDDPTAQVSDILNGLRDGESIAAVMALVGFAEAREGGGVRLYPDIDFQRWMDIPRSAIVSERPLTDFNPGRPGRTVVWVTQQWISDPVFAEGFPPDDCDPLFAGSSISIWPLLPATRLLAAELLDLVPHLRYDKSD
jgi:hypothetical protein